MMKTIHIHIGTHRTGSTALQRFLRAQSDSLIAHGFRFTPGLHSATNHFELYLASMRYERDSIWKLRNPHPRIDASYTDRVRERIQGLLESAPDDHHIFSTEGLSLLRYPDELARLREILGHAGHRVRCLLFVREAPGFLDSYRELLQKNSLRPDATDPSSVLYVEDDSWLVNHAGMIDLYQRTFGPNSLTVLRYEDVLARFSDVIPAFFEWIRLEQPVRQDAGTTTAGLHTNPGGHGDPEPETPQPLPRELPAHLAPMFPQPVLRAESIHRPQLAGIKQTFRVRLADGSTVKARTLLTPEHATEWLALRRHVGERQYLASMIAASGQWVIEEWVRGTPLGDLPAEPADIEESAAVLAELHSLPITASLSCRDAVDHALARIDTLLAALIDGGAIDSRVARTLLSRASDSAPVLVHAGILHYDFCPENLVRHAGRGIVSIDHEWLQVGAVEMDLARMLARWPLAPDEQRRFLRAYHAAGGRGTGDLDFWKLYVDVLAAEFRVRRGLSEAAEAVRRLAAHCRDGGS